MKMFGRGLAVLVLCALTAAGGWFYALHGQNEEHHLDVNFFPFSMNK